MNNRQKAILFSAIAAVAAASSALYAANKNTRPIMLILPLVLMGVFLCAAGYYVGLSRSEQ